MAETVLVVDFGQTWCKALRVDRAGRVVAEGRVPTRGLPGFGFGPAEGEAIWRAFGQAVRDAGGGRPAAVAVSSRIGLGVWLDGDGRPLEVGDVPLEAGDDEMDAVYGDGRWRDDALPTYAPMLVARTCWLRRERPQAFGRARRVGALHDWLLLKLTGRWATNPATGPGLPAAAWPSIVSELTGLPPAAFPEVLGFPDVVGGLTDAAAAALGLPAGTPVVAGYHDGAAATVGTGCLAAGDTCVTLGTSVAISVVSDRPPGAWFRYPVAPDRWACMRGLELALGQVQAMADELAQGHAELTAPAEGVPPGSDGLRLPPLPPTEAHRRAEAVRAALAGGFSPAHVYRAALEGVALGVLGLVVQARGAGLAPRRFVLTGGGVGNRLLVEMLAAVLDGAVELGEVEAGARGACLVAAVGAGWHPSIPEAASRLVRPTKRVTPRAELVEAYRPLAAAVGRPIDPWEPRPYWRALAT